MCNDEVPFKAEEQARKREIRLLKNREAARECRNKKKEYIKVHQFIGHCLIPLDPWAHWLVTDIVT